MTDHVSPAQIDAVLAHVDAGLETSLERLYALLRIKSISTDPAFKAQCQQAADWIVGELKTIGFDAAAHATEGHPVVWAKGPEQDGAHVLFYAHYDVQPVDPLDLWHSDPFEPVLKTDAQGRKIIVARGASDDKGQMMTFIEACRAWQAVTGTESLVSVVLTHPEANARPLHLCLQGLEEEALYRLDALQVYGTAATPESGHAPAGQTGGVYSGSTLLYAGLTLPPMIGDAPSLQLHLTRLP